MSSSFISYSPSINMSPHSCTRCHKQTSIGTTNYSPTMPSSKRELHGSIPRPSPLKVSKDSLKGKKPAPSPSDHRSPVIVHLHSPKVIHARPQDFMGVVQLLTGKSSAMYGSVQRPEVISMALAQNE